MASDCYLHCCDQITNTSDIMDFTDARWTKILSVSAEWKLCDGAHVVLVAEITQDEDDGARCDGVQDAFDQHLIDKVNLTHTQLVQLDFFSLPSETSPQLMQVIANGPALQLISVHT